MKKSIPVRILTALAGLALLALAAGVVAESFFAVPVTQVAGGMLASGSVPAVLLKIVGVMLIVALAVSAVICALPGRKPKQTGSIMQKGVDGPIGITITAIEKMVLACAQKHAEITHTDVDVAEARDGVVILMNVQQVGGVSIPLSVARLQKQVRKYVNDRTGLDVVEVRVMVDNESDSHVDSEFEVQDTVMPGGWARTEPRVSEPAQEAEPLSEQLRQIAQITQQTAAEESSAAEEEPAAEMPVATTEELDALDALLPVAEAAPEMFDEEEKPLHQRVFGAEEMPFTVPMPPDMTQEAQPADEAPADEEPAPMEAAVAQPQPIAGQKDEDWSDPSMQAAAEAVLTGDAQESAVQEEEELPVM